MSLLIVPEISAVATSKLWRISLPRLDLRLSSRPSLALFLTGSGTMKEVLSPLKSMKTYPLEFVVNGINYTANLLDVDLQELLAIFQAGFDPSTPSTLISRAKLREVQNFLNESDITPPLPDLAKCSDLNDRMNLFKAVGAVQLIALKDTVPDWESIITPDQVKLVDEYTEFLTGKENDTLAA
jgi:hypothetical protein